MTERKLGDRLKQATMLGCLSRPPWWIGRSDDLKDFCRNLHTPALIFDEESLNEKLFRFLSLINDSAPIFNCSRRHSEALILKLMDMGLFISSDSEATCLDEFDLETVFRYMAVGDGASGRVFQRRRERETVAADALRLDVSDDGDRLKGMENLILKRSAGDAWEDIEGLQDRIFDMQEELPGAKFFVEIGYADIEDTSLLLLDAFDGRDIDDGEISKPLGDRIIVPQTSANALRIFAKLQGDLPEHIFASRPVCTFCQRKLKEASAKK